MKIYFERIRTQLQAFFLTPSTGETLSLLRVVIGIAMLTEAIRVFPYLDQLYGPYGYLQADLIEALTGMAIPGMLAKIGITDSAYLIWLHTFYIIHFCLAGAFLFGFKTRYANVGLWITQTILINSGYLSSYGVDRYYHNLLFLMMWLPVAQHWSLDQWFRKSEPVRRTSCTLGLRLIQIFILMTYLNAGLAKSRGTDWWNGEAVWRSTNQPEFHHFSFLWLAQVPWLPVLLSRSTVFIESLYAFFVWIPWLGPLWVFAIIGLHIGIAFTMGLTLFGLTLAAVNATLFLPIIPRWLSRVTGGLRRSG
jgi:Vitamin K-dependent gamma-carboxylase